MTTSRFRIFFVIGVIVIAIASMAMMLAVSNRSDPEAVAEPAAAEEAVAQEGGEAAADPAPDTAAQEPFRVANSVPVNDITVDIAPLNTEEIDLLPLADVQPVAEEQPAQEQPAQEQPAEQPAEQAPADPAPTQAPTQAPVPTAAPTAVPDTQPVAVGDARRNTDVSEFIPVQYTVVAGDTMYNISQRDGFNTTVEFMQRHGLSTSDMIVNAVVNIPVVNPEYCVNSTPHIVLEKQNTFRIALNAGTNVQTLAAINGLVDPAVLSTGQLLCVP